MAIAENYEEVLKSKYPAKAHAKKVAEWIVEKGGDKKGTIYLEAQKQKLNEVCGLNLWIEIHVGQRWRGTVPVRSVSNHHYQT
jgi:hypothetical protein